jgi:hypothetical protein
MNIKRTRPEEDKSTASAKRTRVDEELLVVVTLVSYLGDEQRTFFIPESELDAEDDDMIRRAKNGDWQPVEPDDLLGITEDDYVDRCMNGTKEQYLANEKKPCDQIEKEMENLREKYRRKRRKALFKRYPHRAEENGTLDRYDSEEHCHGAAFHYFEEVFQQKHAEHCVCIFGGNEEKGDATGETLGGATYSRKLHKRMPRSISTPFEVNKPFSRFICLNFSNGGCA